MTSTVELVREGRYDEVWRQYCGFLDLSLDGFMKVQRRLLLEQLDLVNRSPWGKAFLKGHAPANVEEFRRKVPLSTFEEYVELLSEKCEDILPRKPVVWAHTSGRSGSYKWVPYTPQMYAWAGARIMSVVILSMARSRGDVRLRGKDVFLYNTPPRPYTSGIAMMSLAERYPFTFVPPLEQTEQMTFQERMEVSFQMALATGIDVMGAITSVLVKLGERFAQGGGGARLSWRVLHPKALVRLIPALVRCRLAGRPMLPRDLWSVKGVICGGTDTSLQKETIARYWGVEPFEMYAFTEGGCTIACQAWDKTGLYFFPEAAFLEFIPEDEWTENRKDPLYAPKTVLLDEVKPGQRYELVITSFDGGPFLRYRIGDLIRFITPRDEKTGINLPSMVCAGRADGLIDIGGFTGLIDEPMIWRAIHETGIGYEDWTVRKEFEAGQAVMHIYLELKENHASPAEIRDLIHENLKAGNPFYADLEAMLEIRPLRVTLLPQGTFRAYYLDRQSAGADLAHLKPPHINPSDDVMHNLLGSARKALQGA